MVELDFIDPFQFLSLLICFVLHLFIFHHLEVTFGLHACCVLVVCY